MLSFILAISPIVIVLVGIMAFRMSAYKIAPIALIWGMFLALTYFNITGLTLRENIVVLDANVWKGMKKVIKETIKSLAPVMITMGSLLCLSYIMQSETTGMMSTAAKTIAGIAGTAYPAAAVVIGAFGSFITGTGLGSNIMFAGMHMEAAQLLNINPITVFAGQNAAGSLGNLICPNNVVAACATVNQIGREGDVLRITFKAFFVILVEYMIIAMLYTYVIFPTFGL